MTGAVDLRQVPIAADDAIMALDCDPAPRRYMARVDGVRYSVIVSRDNIARQGGHNWRWHVSVAGQRDVPTWSALTAIVHEIRPGMVFCVPLPPRDQWLNHHPHCLHAWEIDDAGLEAQWAFEGRLAGDRPT